ncbi:TerB family tellurite resistance protein [Myxococcota bacterium]|nr:TerB family tellurite resistance protein [Myxococcota bacterium]
MRLFKVSKMPRQELLFLAKLMAPSEVFPLESSSNSILEETIISSLGSMFSTEPLLIPELETFFFHRLSRILQVKPQPDALEDWSLALDLALGERILREIQPLLQVLHLMGWADGKLSSEELEVYDAVFSRLNVLRPFRNRIIEICTQPVPRATIVADLQQITHHRERAEQLLSFAWVVAMVDQETHEEEINAFHDLADILQFSRNQRREIAERTVVSLRRIKREEPGISGPEAALRASGADSFVQRVAGLSFLPVLSRGRFGHSSSMPTGVEALHSLTLFSKLCILSGPEFSLLDRVVLLLALLIVETD